MRTEPLATESQATHLNATRSTDAHRRDQELLDAIERFDIDGHPATVTFERRLARECGWSVAFAQRVVQEYRRFVYLAMTAGHPVTPSDEVDQAWHLHMTCTESYWSRLCGQVLPRPLHHNPTAGGAEEDAKFRAWYERTLAAYARAFGHAPPADIWPPTGARFDPRRAFRRVRSSEYWLIRRLHLRLPRWGAVGGVAVFAPLLLGAAGGRLTAVTVFGLVLVMLVGVIVLLAIVAGVANARRSARNDAVSVSGGDGDIGFSTWWHAMDFSDYSRDSGGGGGSSWTDFFSGGDSGGGDAGGGDGGGCGGGGCGGGCGS